jgi:sec-independent protein translocase protein TatA
MIKAKYNVKSNRFRLGGLIGGRNMYGFIGNIGPWELIFILVIALIVVGPGKLPEVAKSMGKALNEFKKTTSGVQKEFQDAIKIDQSPVDKPAQPITQAQEFKTENAEPEDKTETSNN